MDGFESRMVHEGE